MDVLVEVFFFLSHPSSDRVQNVLVSHAVRGREHEVRSCVEGLSLPVC